MEVIALFRTSGRTSELAEFRWVFGTGFLPHLVGETTFGSPFRDLRRLSRARDISRAPVRSVDDVEPCANVKTT